MSPCDVLITWRPWHSRQPDVLLISSERLAQNPPADNPAPLSPAPEVVVEIVSPSVLTAKIEDYRNVDVQEVWIVRSGPQTVEILPLSSGRTTDSVYGRSEVASSLAFKGLAVPVDDIFQE